MPQLSTRFDRMVPAVPDAVGPLRRQLRRFARAHGASPAVQGAVALAFSEAGTAAVRAAGARRPGDTAPLMVQAVVRGDELELRVSHRVRRRPPPGEPGEAGDGAGFGVALMAQLADRFEIRRRQNRPGTTTVMTFNLAGDASGGFGPGYRRPRRP